MGLNFPGDWRFDPPADGRFANAAMPNAAVSDCVSGIIEKIRTKKSRWHVLEHFKSAFGATSTSSAEDWAYTDLWRAVEEAGKNAPLFIEALYDGCESLREESGGFVPEVRHINAVLAKHNVGYLIEPPNLVPRELMGAAIAVEKPSPRFAEQANEVLEKSLGRSEELLIGGHPREAVQEILWLLETVSTAFRGLETQSGKVEGKFFNRIVGDLRKLHRESTLDRVLDWITTMHGYLSSPSGGGVRHGTDLNKGIHLDANEARLFCNLTRSYISFLIVEHESLCRPKE
jgi:hypothetical protein